MISIVKNKAWEDFEKIFSHEWRERFEWFLYEFGRQATYLFHTQLLDTLSNVVGVEDYKDRLVIAELRQKKKRSWFAIAALAQSPGNANFDGRVTLITVVPRFTLGAGKDPITEILADYGPWTIDTIPFIPSIRQAAVVITAAEEAEVAKTANTNLTNAENVSGIMKKHGVTYEPRFVVWKKLRVVPDWAVEAIKIEYGLVPNSKAHWRPTIRWMQTQGIRKLATDKQLRRVWFDPTFAGYKNRKKVQEHFTERELKDIQDFQNKVRRK